MIQCIAIDDEPFALIQIAEYIKRTPFLELVASCTSALEAIEIIASRPVDLLFVDINMPDLSGMDFVKSLVQKPMVIFTTAYSEYALEGFKVDALDYLLKPIGYEDFLKSATKALQHHNMLHSSTSKQETESAFLYFKADYKMVKIAIDDIQYIESQSEYVRIFTHTQPPIMTLLSMKTMEEALAPDKFMRVHRSYIVNLQNVMAVSRGRIIMDKEVTIPIGDQYKDKFQEYLNKHYIGRE